MGVGQGGNFFDDAETLFRLPYSEHIERQRRYPHEGTVAVVAFARAARLFRGHAFLEALNGFCRRVADVKHRAVRRVRRVGVPVNESPSDIGQFIGFRQ